MQLFKNRVFRISLSTILFFLFLFIYLGSRDGKPLCKNCNVILVSIDTLSALHLPCYGYERDTAPNLCAFAKKNILFTNSYSQSPITLNSHFSIMTSLYPHTHKMTQVLADPLDEKFLTLPQLLRANGYKTIFHGPTWDFHLPLDRGFERGFDIIEPDTIIETWKDAYPKLLKNAEEKKPTFLFLHTYATHTPYLTGRSGKHLYTNIPDYPNVPLTREEYLENSSEFFSFAVQTIYKEALPGAGADKFYKIIQTANELRNSKSFEQSTQIFNKLPIAIQYHLRDEWSIRGLDFSSKNVIDYERALYDERIHQMDEELKKLLDLIEDPRLSKNTILIITSDHGEEFKEHGYMGHAVNLYKTSIKVPLIMYIPGVGPKKIEELVQGIDIYPTVINMLGIQPKSYLEGINMTGLIMGYKNPEVNKYIFSEYDSFLGNLGAIQDDKYRFYFDKQRGAKELYDLRSDPGEQKNILFSNPLILSSFLKSIQMLSKK